MGYSTETDFQGQFNLDKPLSLAHKAYLTRFGQTRRMMRDKSKVANLNDRLRMAAGIQDPGTYGCYYVGAIDKCGQTHSPDIIDYNQPPTGQPGLWCQWTPNEDGTAIIWDEGEKFSDYGDWIVYLIEHFLKPWGYVVNGLVTLQGEDHGDIGTLVVRDNELEIVRGQQLQNIPPVGTSRRDEREKGILKDLAVDIGKALNAWQCMNGDDITNIRDVAVALAEKAIEEFCEDNSYPFPCWTEKEEEQE